MHTECCDPMQAWKPGTSFQRLLVLGLLSFLLGSVACWLLATTTETSAQSRSAEAGVSQLAPGTAPESGAGARPKWSGDCAQWGGSPLRNNVREGKNIPERWEVGDFDRRTGAWKSDGAVKIRWVARLGSQAYGNPVVADGRIFLGTNNGAGYLARYPDSIDLGCLLAFDIRDGSFLWQHSSEKLPTGRVHDWPLQGICCAPLVEGKRLWYVTSRGKVVCLDTEGFRDGEDDGPLQGLWGNLFREAPAVTAGLEQNLVAAPLNALLRKAGVSMSGRIRVDGIDPATWKLTIRDEAAKTPVIVRVHATDQELQLDRLGETDDAADSTKGERLASFPLSLLTGLEKGQLNESLLALLDARGCPVDKVLKVEATTPGTLWNAQVQSGGATRELEIRKVGPNLAVSKKISADDTDEADEVWSLDMMGELGVSQHNMCSCSVTSHGDLLFVNTSNGVDEAHKFIPNIKAPSFLALDKNTGKLIWADGSPGENILHGQWSSPAVAEIQGVPQVVFGAGDGWVYSFRADRGADGKPELLWKFDANPKKSKYVVSGLSTRNHIIGTPVFYQDRVYVAVGEDPEHGEGDGHLWCIDPTKRGDISAELAVRVDDRSKVLPPRRLQAVVEENGETAIDNPNSGVIWHYSQCDLDGDGESAFEETMHRSVGSVAIKDDLLFIVDLSGIFHCLDAKTGQVHWTHDMMAQAWGSPLIVDGKVYIGDEDGELSVFTLTAEPHEPLAVIDMRNSVYSTPILADNVLYIANRTHVFAIGN